jgi:hypothetical protein
MFHETGNVKHGLVYSGSRFIGKSELNTFFSLFAMGYCALEYMRMALDHIGFLK